MKKTPIKQKRLFNIATRKHLLPIVAGGLAAAPASAIELGDVVVQSRLGEPLRASIAYALAPHEEISNSCVSLGLGHSASGLPGIGRATVNVADGSILLSGSSPIREPMVATSVVINCPYAANLSREYMMFIDPAGPAYEAPPAATTSAAAPAVNTAARRPTATPAAAAASRPPIGKSTRYQVQRGDSLSVIAQRIENRPLGLWPAVNAIFAANPDAFMDNDPNKLKAGSWLEIPSFDGSETVIAAPQAAPAPQTAAAQSSAYNEFVEDAPQQALETTPVTEPVAAIEAPAPAESVMQPLAVDETLDATNDLRPGDIILDGEVVGSAGSETIIIPDTELDGPETASSSPNVPTAVVDTGAAAEPSGSSWLYWLAGGGLASIFAVLLFGGRLRRRSSPLSPVAMAGDLADGDTESLEAIADAEYDLDDDSPTAENLALDADLFVGTGLEEGTDMEVAEDFGFASPTEVDIELPFEPLAPTMQTDIIAPVRSDEQSILDSEVLPDDDNYDMSVIVDATKMPQPEDVTERDLQAVQVEAVDDAETTDNYTIDREAGFDILQQDYEDEMTATQALNQEIARAAAELADRMEDEEDITSEMPLATVTELDVTAQLPRRADESDDPDDTVESEGPTINTTAEDKTVEMPATGNDDTVEMDVESGKVDTRAG